MHFLSNIITKTKSFAPKGNFYTQPLFLYINFTHGILGKSSERICRVVKVTVLTPCFKHHIRLLSTKLAMLELKLHVKMMVSV